MKRTRDENKGMEGEQIKKSGSFLMKPSYSYSEGCRAWLIFCCLFPSELICVLATGFFISPGESGILCFISFLQRIVFILLLFKPYKGELTILAVLAILTVCCGLYGFPFLVCNVMTLLITRALALPAYWETTPEYVKNTLYGKVPMICRVLKVICILLLFAAFIFSIFLPSVKVSSTLTGLFKAGSFVLDSGLVTENVKTSASFVTSLLSSERYSMLHFLVLFVTVKKMGKLTGLGLDDEGITGMIALGIALLLLTTLLMFWIIFRMIKGYKRNMVALVVLGLFNLFQIAYQVSSSENNSKGVIGLTTFLPIVIVMFVFFLWNVMVLKHFSIAEKNKRRKGVNE